MCFCDCLPSAAGGAGAGCPRCDAYQASPESGNPLVPVPLRLSSRPAARARRGPGRGALGPFANQKNRRAQNDLGRSPPKAQHRPLGLLQTRPTRQKRSRTSLRDLPYGAAAPKRPRNARAPRRWFFEDTPRWRAVNELSTNEFIIVVRRDQIFRSGGPGTHPRCSPKARAAAGQFADSPSREAINGLPNP